MIKLGDFEHAVCKNLGRDISAKKNPDQNYAINAPMNESLFLVAGPGSGKTTAIALRVLKLIFVDDVVPFSIVVTTFTKKAASELRSRILGWGDQLAKIFLANHSYSNFKKKLNNLNLNSVVSGTIDSISEEVLNEYRAPGEAPPVMIEEFVANAIMIQAGLFNQGRFRDQDLKDYLISLRGNSFGFNVSEMSNIILEIKDRIAHDQISLARSLEKLTDPGIKKLCEAIRDYEQELDNRLLFDFARLEQLFLAKLKSGKLDEYLKTIRFVLVDEYQDTNLLQEQTYFVLAKAAIKNGGSITVVGDDDQSLYRFRGATVDLFQIFQKRLKKYTGTTATLKYLLRNYRSTQAIVDFCNDFVTVDKDFQSARVKGKPKITASREKGYPDYPILGMFRDNPPTLAADLGKFIHDVLNGKGYQIKGTNLVVKKNPQGSPSDIALLLSSPRETGSNGKLRLPLLIDRELRQQNPPIKIFNPRGQQLSQIEAVEILCGLILECIDPQSKVQKSIQTLPRDATANFELWRRQARNYIKSNPAPNTRVTLRDFVNSWQKRQTLNKKSRKPWAKEVPLIDLIYKLVTWLPLFQDDVEGIVYLEALTRAVTQSSLFNKFEGTIINDPKNAGLSEASIKEIFRNVLTPLAIGAIDVNEDLLETLPTDRINILSIHQAKGLEFPLVIVDVGSDFNGNYHAQKFKRFPCNGGKTCNMEDELRKYSPLKQSKRSALDRAFDDLIRHYFVAYSRPQDVLLLVGLNTVKDNGIKSIACGWTRREQWKWGQGLPDLLHI